eukprot:TRINITY_DN10982_c0_g2_i1.p1 TRINITY_DN10982_c0_g2~~TRINITY_DN10982_c0_g2_i1.p1  ORF type:complete len:297 (+),score=31.27 TRINITY_DN10982_c0_g2_i1:547-1437(+)
MGFGGRRSSSWGPRSPSTLVLAMMLIMSVLLLVLLVLGIVGVPSGVDVPSAGTKGAEVALQLPSDVMKAVSRQELTGLEEGPHRKWIEVVSWEPRAFVYHNFLSGEECEHLIKLASPNMVKSTVVDSATGRSKDSRVRTSSGTFLGRGQDEIITRIEKRLSEYTFIPVEHGEGLQVLHYEVGQKYEPHYDYFHDKHNTKNGGQRIATVLMYLSDVGAGGETVFPASKTNNTIEGYEMSECAHKGLAVRPTKGDALLFWSMTPEAQLDPTSLHGGCPVIRGNKWSATKWMHVHEYSM